MPFSSSISEPGYGLIERWEPGEIVDQDFEMSSSLSTSSSPVRSYQQRYRRDRVSKVMILTEILRELDTSCTRPNSKTCFLHFLCNL